MSFKQSLRKIGLRVALGSIRKLEANAKQNAALLSDHRRQGTVALVWALDEAEDHLSNALKDQLEKLAEFETVVIVCPPRFFSALRSRGLFFETLPPLSDLPRSGVSANWDLYLKRRIARIRESWAPDFEFTVGSAPEDYILSLLTGDHT
ncbi:hypothetical protein V1T76_24195 [Roseibium sp. FZY0029]|uniref:hypothetical protein n=1 Tax=Roseibium sp. FZY0029 TaxID=3116647 RepID=UPI002EC950AD|nr:hypothetical protein [Roseibium sp. FZY0029]